MSIAGLEERHNRVYTNTIGGLLILTVAMHLLILTWETKTFSQNIFSVFLSQVNNIVKTSAQTGDLISLQQNLESIANPLSSSLPIDVRISRADGQKLIVNARSPNFFDGGWFHAEANSSLMANPFGEISISTTLDYSSLVFASIIKILISCSILVTALLVARAYVLKMSRMNLVPVDQFTSWLARMTPEDLRSGQIATPAQLKDERLRDLFSEINILANDLAQRELQKRLNEVATQTAHDIRSPLSALKIVAGKMRELDGETRNLVLHSVDRIEAIASELLTTYKHPEKCIAPATESHSLAALLSPLLAEKFIQYSTRQELSWEEDWETLKFSEWRGSLNDCHRVLSNLINNAAEAIDGPGVIAIRVRQSSERITISICDNGRGISKEHLSKIGQRGFSQKEDGFGFGLNYAKVIAIQLGGKLEIQSKPGLGTIVSFSLPLNSEVT